MNATRPHSKPIARWLSAALLASILAIGVVPVTPASVGRADAQVAEPWIDLPNLDPVPERAWGVSGVNPADTQTQSLDVLVWDMVQIDDRMFVGGAFLNVQEDKDSAPIAQSFVAAFDARSGDWISDWRPTIDRAVYSLAAYDGMLLVGGEFEQVNGRSRTGLVALDPITGATDANFDGYVERPWSELRAIVRDIKVDGDNIYVVGNFSHLNGAYGVRTRVYKAARLTGRLGEVDASWKPQVTGSGVWGVDVNPANTEVYLAGYFSAVNGEANTGNFHTVDTAGGGSVPGKIELPRNYPRSQPEIFDVSYGDNTVFTAGEQHIVQVLREQDQQMLGYHHTGQTTDDFTYTGGFAGGAFQSADRIGEWVVAGCHCTYSERNGYVNHFSSFTGQRTPHRVFMVYHADSGRLYESFVADISSPRDGAWTATGDTFGCLWAGGDFHVGGVDHDTPRWVGGFARFCPPDFDPDAEPEPEPDPNILVEAGSSWRFDVTGDDLGTAWKAPSFDDAAWTTGDAEFGFGDGDETTLWPGGITTYYARTEFDHAGSQPSSLAVSLKADDGAVVYLNGVELLRDNMPDGTITASTQASTWKGGADEDFVDYVVPADALVAGRNVLAVEVHNVWRNNNDLSLDLELSRSADAPPVVDGPLVPRNAVWQYDDSASSAPNGWRTGLAGVATGAGPFGFGEDFHATEVEAGNTTYYFTRSFHVADPNAVSNMTMSLLADDGAAVYVNGEEVHRFNLPNGTIDHLTEATTWVAGSDERTYVDTTIPAHMLVAGTNVIAVEVHNIWSGNSDLGFDLGLEAVNG